MLPKLANDAPSRLVPPDVLGREELVRRRDRAVEGELAVAVLGHLDEGERGARGRLLAQDRGRVHARALQGEQDEVPEQVVAQAPDEPGLGAQPRGGDRHVGRRPARPRGERQLDVGGARSR